MRAAIRGVSLRALRREGAQFNSHSLAKASARTHDDKFDERSAEVEIPLARSYAEDVTGHTYPWWYRNRRNYCQSGEIPKEHRTD